MASKSSSKYGYIGQNTDANGTVNVQDENSKWTITDHLVIGYQGQGTLNIKNGATVNTADIFIGYNGHVTLGQRLAQRKIHQLINTTTALTGTGTINMSSGVVYDKTITLQNQNDLQFTTILNDTNQNITLNTDLSQYNYELGRRQPRQRHNQHPKWYQTQNRNRLHRPTCWIKRHDQHQVVQE